MSSQVTIICIALLTIQIVSKQLYISLMSVVTMVNDQIIYKKCFCRKGSNIITFVYLYYICFLFVEHQLNCYSYFGLDVFCIF